MSYVYLSIAIIAEVVATTFLKETDSFTRPIPTIVMAIGYLIAFYFLSLTLREMPTGVAYALWSGVGVILIVSVGWIVHDQKLDLPAVAGIALIVAGVVVMNLFSRSTGH